MYEFSYIHFHLISSTATLRNQLPVALIAQLVEHCTSIAEVMASNLVQAWLFFRLSFACQLLRITAMIIQSPHGLRRTRFAKYRSSNLEILHFRCSFLFSLYHANRNLTGVVIDIFNSKGLFIISSHFTLQNTVSAHTFQSWTRGSTCRSLTFGKYLSWQGVVH